MDAESMNKIVRVLRESDDFLITAHVNPEGDSIGSQLALYHVLRELGKNAVIADHDEVPDNLRFLPGAAEILKRVPDDFDPKTVIMLDCPVKERTGDIGRSINGDKMIVNVDHHVSNEFFGDINWVEPRMSCVGEMLYHIVKSLGLKLTKDLAMPIYAAIVTDTGMFNYDNTSSDTHRIAAELIKSGISPKEIFSEIYERKALPDIRLLGKALSTLKVEAGGAIAHMCLTRQMYRDEGVDIVSTDEFINFPRSIKGVRVAVFFKESGDMESRVNVSFRSTGRVNVNKIAARFGGGGHPAASGCVIDGGLDEVRDKVVSEIKNTIGGE